MDKWILSVIAISIFVICEVATIIKSKTDKKKLKKEKEENVQ